MAEVCRLGNQKVDIKLTNSQDEIFSILNVLCVFISLVTILADLTTDVLVFAEYCSDGLLYWALPTFIFILAPNIVTNLFSNRWLVSDHKSSFRYWISHICLVGIVERYIIFLHKVFTCKHLESSKSEKLISLRNDLCLLHFLYLFAGTVPQVTLQSYAILVLNENYYTKVFALTASVASIFWGFSNYIYSIESFSNQNFQWKSFMLKLVWHFSTLIGRILSILLFTVVFGIWTLIPLGLHWLAMTFWIIVQKTTFCTNKLEETLYNVVMGFVYCFCYINIKEGPTKYRLMIFYTLILTQNFGSLLLYHMFSEGLHKYSWSVVAMASIIGGTFLGIGSMIIYYRYFHSIGPIQWRKGHDDVELNNKSNKDHSTSNTPKENKNGIIRSFKSIHKDCTRTNDILPVPDQESKNDAHSADKKFLLDHWIARSGTPTFSSAPVGNNSIDASSIEFYTVENTPQSAALTRDDVRNYKVKTICSPTELNLKLSSIEALESSIDEITSNNLIIQKRRAICSSDQLHNNLANVNFDMLSENFIKSIKIDHCSEISHETDGSNKKTSSDSIDMDLDLSFSDINSSDINTFNENIVQKLCLSALKNIKVGNQDADIENIQRIALDILKEMYTKKGKGKNYLNNDSTIPKPRDLETPTEMLSVHDYENICAVNIAREAWGLRSWNGYSDIENWLHDGSVVRDRRRDTLTSGSSEVSSCLSQELKNAILAAPPFPKKVPTYSNVFVKFERTNQDDYANVVCHPNDDTFLAKPCLAEVSKDPNHLEPIIEELDDLCDKEPIKIRLNSESSLVATIDEIRNVTVSNSPRNLYHRRDNSWSLPLMDTPEKMESTLKKALWKEPSKFDSSNIMESLPEKENILNVSHGAKFDPPIRDSVESKSIDRINYTQMNSLYNRNLKRLPKSEDISRKNQFKKLNNRSDQNLQDLSNKDIDLLWHMVSENSMPHSSAENLSTIRSSSLQSLIHKDSSAATSPVTKLNNVKKIARSRPRRKFSILRERFEPRINVNSDEEILCHRSENISRQSDSIVNFKNNFDMTLEKSTVISKKQDLKSIKNK